MKLLIRPATSLKFCTLGPPAKKVGHPCARVIPLFKSGDYNNYNNYRPTSILPYFSKLIEKIVHSRLYVYFDKFHFLNDFQFGFRNNHSTYMSLLLLQSAVSDAIEVALFPDLQKAFDTVNHHLLTVLPSSSLKKK